MKLIALEEHFLDAQVTRMLDEVDQALLSPTRVPGLDELGDARIRAMDEAGISIQVLSHTKPGVQEIEDIEMATSLAISANDHLAEAVGSYPDRFAGFATLATAAPAAAARELERTVTKYGFKGAMINGHTRGAYLDDSRFWGIFEAAEALDVPIYLHPANPHPAVLEAYYKDYPVLGYAPWGYAVETGTHVLRLILSGVFDRFPRLKMVIGHMGELLPFALWRADGRLTPKYPHLKKSVRNYFLEHFSLTTSGVFSTPELLCTANVVGFDNLMFSVDYPFESALPLAAAPAADPTINPPPPAGSGKPFAFDVRQGTSYSVAVSPDGRWLAFDLQGSLWVLAAEGGTARRITDYYGDSHLPTWSPDGSRLAYYSYREGNYNLWTVRPDGTDARPLTQGDQDDREPAWSPDGKTIAFASDRGGAYNIWTIDASGGAPRQLTSGPREDRAPTWSADGKTIAFSATQAGASALYSIAAGGGAAAQLRAAPANARFDAPSYAPDGQLAYVVLDTAGSRLMVGDAPVSASENVFPFRATWQGGQAWYISDGVIRRRSGTQVATVPFSARLEATRPDYVRVRRDFTSTAPRRVLGIQHPALSPDGQKIAFVALGDLWMVSSRGGKPEQLTRDSALEADVAWAPDGKALVYTSDKGGGLPQLWLRDLASGTDRQLTRVPNQPLGAAFSPDGKRVAFLDTDGRWGVAGLQVVDVGSGVVTRLQPSLPQPGKPTWSADGRFVALGLSKPYSASFREGQNQIWVVPADGTGAGFWRDADPQASLDSRGGGGPVWSPDGRKFAAIQDGVLKIWPVTPDATPLGPLRAFTSEASHYPTWSADSRTILYQAADKLKLLDVASGASRDVPLDFNYKLDVPKGRLVIHAGALVDAVTDTTQTDKDIVIEGNRIVAIVAHDPAVHRRATRVIDGTGLTAIPGLIEHHAHSQKDFGANLHLAWLAYGITTVRDPGNQPYDGVEDREANEADVRIGPRIYTTGYLLEWRREFYRMGVAISGPAGLERELARSKALKYDLIKSYVRLPDMQQRRVVEFAHAMGVPVATHEIFPAAYTGVDNTEHLGATSRRGFSPKQGPMGRVYDDVIQLFGRSGRVLTPTNFGALNTYLARHPDFRTDPRVAFYPEWARKTVTEGEALPPVFAAMTGGQLVGLKAMHDAGALIAAGTDTMIAPNLHAEIASYVDAGFTPFEALQTATANAARALNLDAGTLQVGKLADVVLVEGDPRKDISATFQVRHVIANGRAYSVPELIAKGQRKPE